MLLLSPRAPGVFGRPRHASPRPGFACSQGKKPGCGPAGIRKAAPAGDPRGAARKSRAQEDEIAEERAVDHFAAHRPAVSRNPTHGRNRRDARNAVALMPCVRTAAAPQLNLEQRAACLTESKLR